MEHQDLLDPLDEIHLYSLQFWLEGVVRACHTLLKEEGCGLRDYKTTSRRKLRILGRHVPLLTT